MRRLLAVLIIAGTMWCCNAWSRTLATVGQETISTDDINKIKKQLKANNPKLASTISDDEILSQLIDIKTGIMDARLSGIDQKQEAKDAMDAALFNYYRAIRVDDLYKNKNFSKKEIMDYYNLNPIVKFQRLSLPYIPGNEKDSKRAFTKLSVIRSDIEAKKLTFEQAMERLGYEANSNISGTFDMVPLPSLQEIEAKELRSLEPQQISAIITGDDFVSIVRLIKRHPFSSDNIDPINDRLKMEAVMRARSDYFKTLKQKYINSINIQK